jgi:hypothetical protein
MGFLTARALRSGLDEMALLRGPVAADAEKKTIEAKRRSPLPEAIALTTRSIFKPLGNPQAQQGREVMKKAVVGIVESQSQAEALVQRLQGAGFKANDISALFPDNKGTKAFAHEQHTKAPEGAAAGAGAGGVIGGTLGVLAGIGALAIPGLGPFIAAGPIMAGLSGIAAGAAVGGLTGALVGMGIPEFEAKMYETKLKAGNILISVHTEDGDERKRAVDVFKRSEVKDVSTQAEESAPKPRGT